MKSHPIYTDINRPTNGTVTVTKPRYQNINSYNATNISAHINTNIQTNPNVIRPITNTSVNNTRKY